LANVAGELATTGASRSSVPPKRLLAHAHRGDTIVVEVSIQQVVSGGVRTALREALVSGGPARRIRVAAHQHVCPLILLD